MTCPECRAMTARSPNDCTIAERSAVRRHIRDCVVCRMRGQRSLRASLAKMTDETAIGHIVNGLRQIDSDSTDPEA